jgi:uncharacterized membrane protein YqjE
MIQKNIEMFVHVLFIALASYALIAFVCWEINPAKFRHEGRGLVILTFIALCCIYAIQRSEKKSE